MRAGDGLKFLDLSVGSGDEVSAGKKVTVHFDCIYRGIDVVSSRQARLLGGNRTISEVLARCYLLSHTMHGTTCHPLATA